MASTNLHLVRSICAHWERGDHSSVQALEADIRAWIENLNENPRPFAWTKTAEEILNSLAEYMVKISGAPH